MTTLPKNVEHFDRHGFAVFTGGAGPHSERDHAYNRSETHDAQYLAAWQKLLDSWEVHDSIGSTKLETFVKQGIPAELRPAVWKSLLEMESLKSTSKFEYQVEIHAVREQLIDLGISEYSGIKATNGLSDAEMDTYEVKFGQISMDSLRHILLDLDRTYPTHRKYMGQTGEAKEGKAALFRILAAYARYNPSVGYCQGEGLGHQASSSLAHGPVPVYHPTMDQIPVYNPTMGQVPVYHPTMGQVPVYHPTTGQIPLYNPTMGQIPVYNPTMGQVPVYHPTMGQIPVYHPTMGLVPVYHPTMGQIPVYHPMMDQVQVYHPTMGQIPVYHPTMGQVPVYHPTMGQVPVYYPTMG
ncbi:hypothetical protein LSAT2_006954 [Lamellibrachia satsuma]|nr:hypothetical protein LSAT2_006954 [Lamellibrachia satsuma]